MSVNFEASLAFARSMDAKDPLASNRSLFYHPQADGKEWKYFCGNSLGLQPKHTRQFLENILSSWSEMGVEGFKYGQPGWMTYQQKLSSLLAPIVGALPEEVTVMNSLTINLHLLMQTFFQPTDQRTKIMMEAGSFPSDRYAVISMLKSKGLDETHLIELRPRDGEHTLRTDDILQAIQQHGYLLQMVLLSGVQYYTGQLFEMSVITQATKAAGAVSGWDLAHAVGNVPLKLHDWGVDFAVWCHYKYLNSGPGAVGGAFVHQHHFKDHHAERLSGWWGNAAQSRFAMLPDFEPEAGADGWQVSTPNMLGLAAVEAGLSITHEVGVESLRSKSLLLTAFLEYLLLQPSLSDKLEILTPKDPQQRGAQLSVYFKNQAVSLQEQLKEAGIITDYRSPGVIRISPVPLYNSFEDVFRLYEQLKETL
jgi:kynureninase